MSGERTFSESEVYQLVAVAPASGHEPKEPRRA